MIELWVRQEFEAAHSLEDVFPPGHECARLHGHRYTVTLTIGSTKRGDVLVDYYDLHKGLRDILVDLDHANLNDVMSRASTCENICRLLMRRAKAKWGSSVRKVEVQEQRDTGCVIYNTR